MMSFFFFVYSVLSGISPLISTSVSTTAYSSGLISSSGCVRSGTITGLHPAAYAALIPLGESSTATQSAGSSPICPQA